MIKIFKFCLNDCGTGYRKERGKKLYAVSAEYIEKTINDACKHDKIVSVNVNTYTTERHNNGDTDGVYAIYTVLCK